MTYKEKIKYAEEITKEVINNQLKESEISDQLLRKGLYKSDIQNIMSSVKNMLADQYRPLIREKFSNGEDLSRLPELEQLDPDILKKVVEQEAKSLVAEQKKLVNSLLRKKVSESEIMNKVNLNIYPESYVRQQILVFDQVKDKNSFSTRFVSIALGIVIILGGVLVAISTGRIFYVIIILGFLTLGKGLMTQENPYD